jgi:stage V sporulation protein G
MPQDSLVFKVSRLHKVGGDGALRAFADLSINDSLLIKGLRVVKGQKGLFVSMPKQQGKDNRWYATVKPLNKEINSQISSAVLSAYETS